MTSVTEFAPRDAIDSTGVEERPGWSANGWPFAIGGLLALIVGAGLIAAGIFLGSDPNIALIVAGGVLVFVALDALVGLVLVEPGQARVLQLLQGSYAGTLRENGLRWVNPLNTRRAISTRIRNHDTGKAKVNDADGNPIEISAVIVWQVRDTARAMFDVDDFEEFVAVQTEAAVRHIAGSYPYDGDGTSISLRQNADEITSRLSDEVGERVRSAGVQVIESRINQLAYAPEIAQAMLRRQQAGAVIAAREQIVHGAVGMVASALERLEREHTVELDEERKAAMVSNLLVVLCGDQSAQPIVNTGTLYQ
ncbi:SPFH domain-containing protein [Prescottella agglutinans]|uniref:SPFH domain-containing protein n=1 Tax=Prescottella agglutinans TaxID=1644129 RepID=A0A438BB54_9NOCA|nr:SPFH domain-containing protein [Prescottella agglutinans]RVW08182.1 SPFH domain-containing protein [Prescottella agglutinans]